MSVIDQAKELLNKLNIATNALGLGVLFAILANGYNALRGQLKSATLTSAGLVIKAGSSAIVKAGSAFIYVANGVRVYKAANTDMAALVGSLATAKSACWAFYGDDAGTLTTSAKTADADTVAAAIALLPKVPAGKAMIGFIVVSNATGSPVVGGTTALDAGSVTTAYFNTVGVASYDAALADDTAPAEVA
jgi:hypothetical protein